MPRSNAAVPPEAIRIEEEVWQEAFARREPPSANRRRRLQAIEGGQDDWLRAQARERPTPTANAAPAKVNGSELSVATWIATSTPTDSAPPIRGTVNAPPIRRTVKIQGRGDERNLPLSDVTRQRPRRRAYERHGFRPDRLAMWAVLLGFLLVFVAIVSAHG